MVDERKKRRKGRKGGRKEGGEETHVLSTCKELHLLLHELHVLSVVFPPKYNHVKYFIILLLKRKQKLQEEAPGCLGVSSAGESDPA